MKITVNALDDKYAYSFTAVKKIILKLAVFFDVCDKYEISINFCSVRMIKKLNREFRNIDRATDVLSFSVEDSGEVKKRVYKPPHPLLLGDIFMCPDYILKNNVIKGGNDFRSETAYLLVHGFMHLAGFDHDEDGYQVSIMRVEAEKFIKSCITSSETASLIKVKKG